LTGLHGTIPCDFVSSVPEINRDVEKLSKIVLP
jgi:hypothetical protein